MPKCINDPKKSYKGDEPSPKGIGYCAHSEIVGTIRKGLDGNKWIISKTSKNIKRWIKYKDVKENSKSSEELYKIIKKKYIGYKTYFIHYNGGRPYLVYIKNNDVNIYSSLDNIDASLCSNNDNEFDNTICFNYSVISSLRKTKKYSSCSKHSKRWWFESQC